MQSQGGLTGPQPEPQPYQQASYLTQQKAQLQSDPVVQTTAQCMEADLILTEGAYECLTATGLAPGYRGNWEIPFTVQPKPRGPDPKLGDKPDFHLQQVLLDTPLPKRLLNLREKHEMLYQHAVCHLGCSLFSQQQEAAEAAAREGGSAGTHGELPQQEGALDQMLSDDDLDRSSDFEDAPGADPYSPNRDSPYSPSQDRPYSPSNNMLYSHSDGMPSSPGYDANLAEGMTGLTENSSLMPQTAADTASESQPIPTHPGHDFSTSDMPGVPLPAQAASQGGNVAAEERQPGSTQAASQARNTPQEEPQHSSATGYTLATDALPAALPAVSSDNLWAEMETDIDNDVIINHSAGGGAHDSGPQKPAAPQQQEGDAAPGEGTADASRHADGNPEHGEAGLCYQSYKLGGYSIVARAPLPLNVPIKRRLEVRPCCLLA